MTSGIVTTGDNKLRVIDRNDEEYALYDTLDSMQKRLAADKRFYRTHRSYLVNLHMVRRVFLEGKECWLYFHGLPDDEDKRADVARKQLKKVKGLLGL